jgi:hypothetical protein
MEFKTVTGNINRIEEHFRSSRKKAAAVFFKIDSPLSKAEVFKKVQWLSFQQRYQKGLIIAYFTQTAELHDWDITEL